MIDAPLLSAPTDIPAERATIGSLIINRDAIIKVEPFLRAGHFMDPRHARIYQAICDLYHRLEPPDAQTLASELRRRGQLEAVGGLGYLADLQLAPPAYVHVAHYANAVLDAARERRRIDIGGRLAGLAYRTDLNAAEKATAQAQLIAELQADEPVGWVRLGTVVDRVTDRLRDQALGRGALPVESGIPGLDKALYGGAREGDLLVLAALTSAGKSAFAVQWALHAALAGTPVGFISLEMLADQIAQRALAWHAGIDLGLLQRARALGDPDWDALTAAQSALDQLPFYLRDVPAVTLEAVRAETFRLLAEQGVRLLIVDYLQLVDGERKRGTREEAVSAVARGLRLLALEARIPILALAQLSRAAAGADEPQLEHLRESGAIEQNASHVLFLHRPDPHSQPRRIELHIAKNRDGQRDLKLTLEWDGPHQRFTESAVRGWQAA